MIIETVTTNTSVHKKMFDRYKHDALAIKNAKIWVTDPNCWEIIDELGIFDETIHVATFKRDVFKDQFKLVFTYEDSTSFQWYDEYTNNSRLLGDKETERLEFDKDKFSITKLSLEEQKEEVEKLKIAPIDYKMSETFFDKVDEFGINPGMWEMPMYTVDTKSDWDGIAQVNYKLKIRVVLVPMRNVMNKAVRKGTILSLLNDNGFEEDTNFYWSPDSDDEFYLDSRGFLIQWKLINANQLETNIQYVEQYKPETKEQIKSDAIW